MLENNNQIKHIHYPSILRPIKGIILSFPAIISFQIIQSTYSAKMNWENCEKPRYSVMKQCQEEIKNYKGDSKQLKRTISLWIRLPVEKQVAIKQTIKQKVTDIVRNQERSSSIFKKFVKTFFREDQLQTFQRNGSQMLSIQTVNDIEELEPETIERIVAGEPIFTNSRVYSKCQPNETEKPRLVFDVNRLYFTELSHMICALLNSRGGGEIVLVNKIENGIVKEGIENVYSEDLEKHKYNVEKCFKLVRCREMKGWQKAIRVRLDVKPIYESIAEFRQNRYSQYVIKVTVKKDLTFFSQFLNQPMFYLEHKLAKNIPPTFEFCTFSTEYLRDGCFQASYRRVNNSQVYDLIMQISQPQHKILIQKLKVSQNKSQDNDDEKISYVKQKGSSQSKVLYQISLQPSQRFISLLKSVMQDDLQKQFPNIENSKSVIEVEIPSQTSVNLIKQKIQKTFNNANMRAKILYPLKQCQDSLIEYWKKQSPTTKTYRYLYLIFSGDIKKVIKMLRNQINLGEGCFNYIQDQISIGVQMSEKELRILQDFNYSKFCSVAKTIKKLNNGEANKSQEKMYSNISIKFPQYDRHACVAIYFFLQCTRKRPKCTLNQIISKN